MSTEIMTLDRLEAFANQVATSDFAPKDFRGKPANCLIAMMMGREVGLQPLAALQSIAVVNGRPSLWGDGALAVVLASGLVEHFEERNASDAAKAGEGHCVFRRKGNGADTIGKFTVEDAKKAGLWGKAGPWMNYPGRMLQMRARALALRDAFADVMKGFSIAEEAQDMPASAEVQMPRSRSGEAAPDPNTPSRLPPPSSASAAPVVDVNADAEYVADEPGNGPPSEKVCVVEVAEKTSSKGKPYYLVTFRDVAGNTFCASTFSSSDAGLARELVGKSAYITTESKEFGGKQYLNLITIEAAL